MKCFYIKKIICGVVFWVAAHVPYDFHEGKGAVCIPRTYHNAWDQLRCSKTILRKIKGKEQEKIKIKVVKVQVLKWRKLAWKVWLIIAILPALQKQREEEWSTKLGSPTLTHWRPDNAANMSLLERQEQPEDPRLYRKEQN